MAANLTELMAAWISAERACDRAVTAWTLGGGSEARVERLSIARDKAREAYRSAESAESLRRDVFDLTCKYSPGAVLAMAQELAEGKV